jgi:putative membrane protein
MRYLSENTLETIADRISNAESKSSCELLAVFAGRSDDYSYIPMLWAAVAALLLPVIVYIFFPLSGLGIAEFSSLQLLAFMLFAVILRLDRLGIRVVPKQVKMKRAALAAHIQFASHGLNSADAPPAILFFVSFDERYVQIITNAKVQIGDEVWQGIIDKMIGRIKADALEKGMIEAVDEISKVMAGQCPVRSKSDISKFPNRLIIL